MALHLSEHGTDTGVTGPGVGPIRDRRDHFLKDLGTPLLGLGIVNLTPDSFSDGGRFESPAAAVEHAQKLVAEGADIVDIGAESTRPGHTPVPVEVELARLEP